MLLKWYIRKVINEMILRKELQFTIQKETEPFLSPDQQYIKHVGSIKLTIHDKKGHPLAITNTLLEDVVFDMQVVKLGEKA